MKLRTACPWKDHLYDLEAELSLPDPIKFAIYEACPTPLTLTRGSLGRSCLTEQSQGDGKGLELLCFAAILHVPWGKRRKEH